jgi:hypothetical protein
MEGPRVGIKFDGDVPLTRHALLPTFSRVARAGAGWAWGSIIAEIHESNFSLYSTRVHLAYALVLRLRHTG